MAAAGSDNGFKAMRAALDGRAFDPVYYLHGDDEVLKEQSLQRLISTALDPATREFNFESRRGADLDAGTLGSMLSTPPMMAERRVIVLRDPGALRKDARAMLDRYLAAPASDTVLVLTSPAGEKADREIAARSTAVRFDALSDAQLAKWIVKYADELGARITPEAVTLLRDAAGSETSQLRMELDKLGSYVAGGEIDAAAVEAVVGVRHGETLGDLLDAVAMRDGPRALALLPVVLQQPKVSAVTTILALTTQTLALAWARSVRDRSPGARLDFFGLLKEAPSSYTGRSWGEATASWSRAVDRWTSAELDAALAALLHADAAAKDTRVSSDDQILTDVILALCGSGRRRAA